MEKLKELVSIVNRIKTQRIEVITKGRAQKGEKLRILYDGIAKGKFDTDQEAAIFIYGPDYNPTNYTTLKNNLTNRLLNSLFFINLSEDKYSSFQKTFIDVEKSRAIIKLLTGRSSRKTSMELTEKLISKSLKYQFTDVSLDLAKILRKHYRTLGKNSTKAKKYHSIVNEQYEILGKEIELENYYELLVEGLQNKRSTQSDLAVKGKNYANKAKSIFIGTQSHKLGYYAHLIFVLSEELSNNFQGVEKTCKEAIKYHEQRSNLISRERVLGFYIKLLAVYIPLQKFKEGEAVAIKILESIKVGSVNWFLTLEHYFLLSMHTENYEKANEILEETTSHNGFKKLAPYYKEIWLVYEAYIEYLRQAGLLPKLKKKNFKIGKFMNQVPNFSRDKTGINISILIIQVLLLIAQGKETKVIDRVEALRTYVYTHLRNDESLRSNCFIKMLLKMTEANFHQNGTIRKAKGLKDKLSEARIGTKGYSNYVEIIPYEKLWDISLKFLRNRAY